MPIDTVFSPFTLETLQIFLEGGPVSNRSALLFEHRILIQYVTIKNYFIWEALIINTSLN